MKMNRLMLSFVSLLGLAVCSVPGAAMPSPAEVPAATAQVEEQTEISPEDLELAQRAIMAGLETYQAHAYNNELTENDKAIKKALEDDFPAVLNKLSLENEDQTTKAMAELETLSKNLVKLILNNQNLYKADKVNLEAAASIVSMLGLTSAIQSGKLTEEAREVIQMAMQEMLLQMLSGAAAE